MHENIHACTSMNADICVGGVCPKGSGLGKEIQEVQRGCLCSCDFLIHHVHRRRDGNSHDARVSETASVL